MSETTEPTSFWSKPVVRLVTTAILGIMIILSLFVYMAADLVSRDLLDPLLYTNTLIEEDIYNQDDTDKPFFLLNHWITRASPSRVDAAVLNDYEYLLERAQRCANERGQIPNFVGVNFYLNGNVFEVVDELNGVRQVTEQ